MLCGYPHNKIACPKCGSKAVRVSWWYESQVSDNTFDSGLNGLELTQGSQGERRGGSRMFTLTYLKM
jgi:hypothetical protein